MKHTLLTFMCMVCTALPAPPEDKVQLHFPNADVADVLNFYERLTGFHLVRDNQVIGQVSIVSPMPVAREKAIELIESNLFNNGFCLVQTKPDTVEVLGLGKKPGQFAVPVVTRPGDLPKGERIVSYVFKLKFRQPAEMVKLLQTQISPAAPGFSPLTPDDHARTVIVTERTSVVREMIRLVAELDVAKRK